MKKTAKRFLSMLLVLSMVFGLLVFPAAATETEEPAEAVETAAETTPAVEEAETPVVSVEDMHFVPVLYGDGEVVIDEEDPAIIAMEDSLQNVKVLGADGQPVPLTEEEKQTLLGLYQQYMEHWAANAHLLGVQTPFFLSYNDNEDTLGVLGEMLVLANIPLEAVRAGQVPYSKLEGMLQTFLFADMIGVETFGDAIVAARDEVMALIEESGAQTEAQKLLVLNDWLAHNVTFDMPYIMNADKDTNKDGVIDEKDDNADPMVAPNPQKDPYEDVVYGAIEEIYTGILQDTFESKIVGGLQANVKQGYYEGAIRDIYYSIMLETLIDQEAGKEEYQAATKDAYAEAEYQKHYDSDEAKEIYEETYNEELDKLCQHDFESEFTFAESTEVEGTYTATADLTCKICGRFHDDLDATSVVREQQDATCTHGNRVVWVATVELDNLHTTDNTEDKYTVTGEKVTDDDSQKLEHSPEDVAEKPATCTEPGTTAGTRCSVCKTTLTGMEPIATLEHVDNNGNGVCDNPGCTEPVPAAQDSQEPDTLLSNLTVEDEARVTAEASRVKYAEDAAAAEYEALSKDQKTELAREYVRADEEAMAAIEQAALDATNEYMTKNADAIAADPVAFVDAEDSIFQTETPLYDDNDQPIKDENGEIVMMSLADQIHEGWEPFWADCEKNGIPGMVAEMKLSAYQEAIKSAVSQGAVQNGMTEEEADAYAESYLEENAEAIAADPYGFCEKEFGKEAADQFEAGINDQLTQMGIDVSTKTNPEGRVSLELILNLQMNTAMEDLGGMTPNEAIPVYAEQAADGMTEPVLNYWQGSQFGALGRGTAVCLGYTKAFTYLVQYMHPEVYGKNGAETDMSKPENWKTRDQVYVYNEDGSIDIDQNYVVDAVRVTFDAEVTMFGTKEENFNSDHFWNAVKVDGQWYYIDPCYTDVFTLVMARDRVETDGYMNHLYFLFSHTSAMQLYDGNYDVIKTLYYDEATGNDHTSKAYEDSWFSRIKSNTYFADGYAYYLYDSTDMLTLLEEFEEEQQEIDFTAIQKIVRHKLDSDDFGNGDEDYEPLIVLNYEDDDGVYHSRVWDAESGAAVDNEMLTELYELHGTYASIYPSINITMGLYNGKIYFNVANKILSYDIATGDLAVVKEYNTVYGVRDDTNPFGGMAFTTTTADNADFTVENHPIAALTIKEDGNMYVSVATNFGFISGKNRLNPADQSSYGYEFEESNYNPNYSSYNVDDSGYTDSELEQYGYEEELNDNDEFMWTANFVETLSMAHFGGTEHTYEAVSVDAFCGEDAFTENRCTECGAIEADSRVAAEGTAHEHHYIKFDEIYYTKDDGDAWNTGFCYVCTMCGYAVSEPKEPSDDGFGGIMGGNSEEEQEEYEKAKAEYDAAVASAGHDYVASEATWTEDSTSVTFSALECGHICAVRKPYLDVLLNDGTFTVTLEESVTAKATVADYEGDCTQGATAIYRASGEAEGYAFTATNEVKLEAGKHAYEATFTWTDVVDEESKPTGEYAATADVVCGICGDAHEDLEATVALDEEQSVKASCTVEGKDVYVATVSVKDANGNEIGTATSTKEIVYEKLAHDYKDGVCTVCGAGNVARVYGDTRYETAYAVANELKAVLGVEKFDTIIVACGSNFPDALSGSYLAAIKDAPILLAKTNNDALLAYIQENLSDDGLVYILGSDVVVSKAFEDSLKAENIKVERLAGATRYLTNLAILEEAGITGNEMLISTSMNYADSLSASSTGLPILLINNSKKDLTTEQKEFLAQRDNWKFYILGSEAAVCAEFEDVLGEYGEVVRVSGSVREETSIEIAKTFCPKPNSMALAFSQDFPDGLCGGVLAYNMNAPLILTRSSEKMEAMVSAYAEEAGVYNGIILGSSKLISDSTAKVMFHMADDAVIVEKN